MRKDFGLGEEIADQYGFDKLDGNYGIHAEVHMDLNLDFCETWYLQFEFFTFPKVHSIHSHISLNDVFYQVHIPPHEVCVVASLMSIGLDNPSSECMDMIYMISHT